MVTSSAPSSFDCTPASTAVMPPPITTTRRPTGSAARSAAWRSSAMNSTAGRTPVRLRPLRRERVDPAEPDPEEHRVVPGRQLRQRHVAPERPPVLDRDPADPEQPVELGLREALDRLVGRDPELVEPAALLAARPSAPRRARASPADARRRAPPARRRPPPPACRSPPRARTDARPGHQRVGGDSAAAARSPPACPPPPRARRPPRTASRSGRPARTCRRGCSARGWCAPPPPARPPAIWRMNSGMSIEVGQAVTQGAS